MRIGRLFLGRWAVAIGLLALVSPLAFGQGATSGNIVGSVISKEDNTPLAGATVVAVHEPTGTRYTAISRADGRFSMLNVRVGGPYTVSVTISSFKPAQRGDLNVRLGEDLDLPFQLVLQAFKEELVVYAEPNPIFSPYHTGATSNVSQDQLKALPTIGRGFEDFARTSVYFSTTSTNDGPSAVTVAGRNNRYNNIQIDGSVNNDLFGLAAQGTPGGQAETQPISLDAIQELQLLVSPYDVRQGGFSGGGINAITKSGSNNFHGSVFYFTRDESLVGDGKYDHPIGTFSQDQYGFSLGGPILKDRLFFFGSGEFDRRDTPSGYSIGGSGVDFGHSAEAQRFRDILVNTYHYDPGGLDEFTRSTTSNLFFGRLDFNLAPNHELTLRHNYVDASDDVGFPSITYYYFPDNFYQFTTQTNSTVLQLNSVFGANLFNEARVTYQTIKDNRTGQTRFPQVTVELPDGDHLRAGREQFSTANHMYQTITEIHDDLTFGSGDHTFTVGTHNELFNFNNLYIRDNFGTYYFDSLDDFEHGYAETFDYSFSNTSNPEQPAKFSVQQYGLYGGDQWTVKPNLTLTYGVRVDVPIIPDKPTFNPQVLSLYGMRTDKIASGNEMWSPRIGFNWDITGSGKHQLRGGTGVFSGRTPYVWMSNQFGNTGIEFTRLSARVTRPVSPTNYIPFEPDPDNQPTSIGSAATNEINLIDPKFTNPQVWRTSLAYDNDLGWWGLIGSAEAIYSKTLKDILYQNINLTPSGQTLFDGRPLYTRVSPTFSRVIYLSNTDKGSQFTTSLKLEKPFRNGFYASLGYVYNDSKSINDGTSSQASSNWRYQPTLLPNDPELAVSNYEVKHRFLGVASYTFHITEAIGSTVALYFNRQSGRPYSTTYSNDVNGDTEDNDLIYVPRSADEVIVQGGTWNDLNNYIEADAGLRNARGQIVKRNASFAPWNETVDFHYGIDFPISVVHTELTVDVTNLLNLLDKDYGVVRYPSNNEVSPIRYRGIDQASGKPIYEFLWTNLGGPEHRWSLDDLRSRWQAKLGLRLSF